MARIATVYNRRRQPLPPVDMSIIRWLKISDALARLGHQVDMVTNEFSFWRQFRSIRMGPNLCRISLGAARWNRYDVVKTLFHTGFETLERCGGHQHPFIVSKLGSVVAPVDRPGIYFYGPIRERLYRLQERIHRSSRYVTVLSPPAGDLWQECFGTSGNVLEVPGAVDHIIPARGSDPYPADKRRRCLFAGNVYTASGQPEANRVLIDKLNRLGALLSRRDVRLYMMGPGDVSGLDETHVTYLGCVDYDTSWQYLHHADVGVVVMAGPFQHNNESTKIYHYLRAGLPTVTERGFPNEGVIEAASLGAIVDNADLESMAEQVQYAATAAWDRVRAIDYILQNHTWDVRVKTYQRLFEHHGIG